MLNPAVSFREVQGLLRACSKADMSALYRRLWRKRVQCCWLAAPCDRSTCSDTRFAIVGSGVI